jgi:hypothetical protein
MKAKCENNIHNVVMFSIATTVIRLNTISTLIMNPKMNNNDRKNLSKTIAMAGMGFLLIAAGFTFSFANSGQQSVYAQQQQQGGNATTDIDQAIGQNASQQVQMGVEVPGNSTGN